MRVTHRYHVADRHAHFRSSLDRTPSDFAESLSVHELIPRLKSRDDFERLFFANTWQRDFRSALNELLDPDRKTLSIGSGFGEIELPFVLAGYPITCADFMTEGLEHARRFYPELRYIAFDVLTSPIDGAYDDILITGLDYAFDDAQARTLFDSCARALAMGGSAATRRLILTQRCNDNLATRFIDDVVMPVEAAIVNLRWAMRRSEKRLRRKPAGFRRSRRELQRLTEASGFSLGRIRHACFGVEATRSIVVTKCKPIATTIASVDRRLRMFNNVTVYEFVLERDRSKNPETPRSLLESTGPVRSHPVHRPPTSRRPLSFVD